MVAIFEVVWRAFVACYGFGRDYVSAVISRNYCRGFFFILPHHKWGSGDSIDLPRCYYGADLLQWPL